MSDHMVETKQKRNSGEGPTFESRDSVRCAASDLLGRMADFDYQLKKKNHKSIFSVQQITCYS